ncbi:uncharacterized protein TNCV_973371 [Trichonephila clavipes]|nr:uncharacterized protein TNCV_973371 [Trichonephila clavipes]
MFLAGHPSQGCFGLQSHCAPCYFFNQASLYPSDFSFTFDQVSGFDRGRIVAYRYIVCGLSFRKIGSRVGRIQTTVMRICDRWMKEGTTDRRGRSHPPQCTASRDDSKLCTWQTTDISAANDAMKEGRGWQNGMKLSLLRSHASVCNTTMVGFESEDTVERGC